MTWREPYSVEPYTIVIGMFDNYVVWRCYWSNDTLMWYRWYMAATGYKLKGTRVKQFKWQATNKRLHGWMPCDEFPRSLACGNYKLDDPHLKADQ